MNTHLSTLQPNESDFQLHIVLTYCTSVQSICCSCNLLTFFISFQISRDLDSAQIEPLSPIILQPRPIQGIIDRLLSPEVTFYLGVCSYASCLLLSPGKEMYVWFRGLHNERSPLFASRPENELAGETPFFINRPSPLSPWGISPTT